MRGVQQDLAAESPAPAQVRPCSIHASCVWHAPYGSDACTSPVRRDDNRQRLSGLGVGHAERVEVGGEHRFFLAPLVLVLLAQANDRPQRLHVEPVALRLGIDLAQVCGEGCLLLLEPLDAGNERTKLVSS